MAPKPRQQSEREHVKRVITGAIKDGADQLFRRIFGLSDEVRESDIDVQPEKVEDER